MILSAVGHTQGQRCWGHKTANVLNKLPKSQQPKAKAALQEIWMAATREQAHRAFDRFIVNHEASEHPTQSVNRPFLAVFTGLLHAPIAVSCRR
jgi:transposase-like protein